MVAPKLSFTIKRTQTTAQDKSVLISRLEMASLNNPSKFYMIIRTKLISMKILTLSLLNLSYWRPHKTKNLMNW